MPSRKMTPTLGILALLFLATVPADLAAQEPLKIAIVDLDRVVLESKAGTALRGRLETLQREAQAEVERRRQGVSDLRERIAAGTTTLPSAELGELRERLEDELIAIRRYQDDKQREADALQSQAMAEVETELEPIFRRLQEEEGYDLILNNVPGVVVMASARSDITALVIERLAAVSGDG